jgi:2-polyprenyl-3-methyl-5-hydroxy-6-metoxy-1,4-benzoquinol methylase
MMIMLDEILNIARESKYDFRETAFPEDPLEHLFPDWISYYKLKWAVARVLQPKSILEIGVGYGYSALAFLNASPSARYMGIDFESPTFGATLEAINWARNACGQYHAEFVTATSTKTEQVLQERYDLIHIDGRQIGERTMHDLLLASRQAEYILVGGYFSSRHSFLSMSEFLYRYRDLLELYYVIPGYTGELLVKMKPVDGLNDTPSRASSGDLRGAYTKDYYLLNCQGYEAFKRTLGARLEDPRLQAVARLAGASTTDRALDLGCGRGELSLELARRGFEVTAIDYSENAIQIAREATSHSPQLAYLISLECNDVNAASLRGPYGIAVAADLIEHMKPSELDRLYQRTADHLARDGLFIIHTYPNLWYYQYEHPRRLRIARQIGAYLPDDPRTRYELLMHINEQSPRVLKRQLRKYFKYVLVWFGHPEQVGENLGRRFSIREIGAAPDLFAVASHSPISIAKLLAQVRMEPLTEADAHKIELALHSTPSRMRIGARYSILVELRNGASTDLRSADPYPVHLAYHWLKTSGHYLIFEGERSRITPDMRSGGSDIYEMGVTAPDVPGNYVLRITLVQERIRWLDQAPYRVYCDLPIACQAEND